MRGIGEGFSAGGARQQISSPAECPGMIMRGIGVGFSAGGARQQISSTAECPGMIMRGIGVGFSQVELDSKSRHQQTVPE